MSLGCVPAVLGNISSLLALYPHSPFPLGCGGFPQAFEEHSSTPIPFLPHVQGNLSTDRWEISLELGKTHSCMCGRLCSTPHRNGFFFLAFSGSYHGDSFSHITATQRLLLFMTSHHFSTQFFIFLVRHIKHVAQPLLVIHSD